VNGYHLGSGIIVIDNYGSFINREEYTPYGETSFGSFARKRYRFTGKERDGESSIYYHGARYYAPHLGQWISSDPAEWIDSYNLYIFCLNNPIGFVDHTGKNSNKIEAFIMELYEKAYENDFLLREFQKAREVRDETKLKLQRANDKLNELNQSDPQFNDRLNNEFREKKFNDKIKVYKHNIKQAEENLRKANETFEDLEKRLDASSKKIKMLIEKGLKLGLSMEEILEIEKSGAESALSDAIEGKNKGSHGGSTKGGGPTWIEGFITKGGKLIGMVVLTGVEFLGVLQAKDEGESGFQVFLVYAGRAIATVVGWKVVVAGTIIFIVLTGEVRGVGGTPGVTTYKSWDEVPDYLKEGSKIIIPAYGGIIQYDGPGHHPVYHQ